jgi:hypothetical protein
MFKVGSLAGRFFCSFLVGKKEPNPARAGHKRRKIQHRRLIRRDVALVLLLIVQWNMIER